MDARQKVLIGVGVAVIVIFAFLFYRFDYVRNRQRIAELQREHQKVELELKKARQVAASLEQVKAKYESLVRQFERAKQMLPTQKDIPSLLQLATDAGLRCGIRFSLFRPGELQANKFYSELPIDLVTEGNYHDLGRFLAALASLPRIVNVSSLTINGTGDAKSTIKAELKATTYVLKHK